MAILLADIGGTNARFQWFQNGKLIGARNYKCDDFKTVYEVIDKFLKDSPRSLNGIVIAGAGPVKNETLKWTNRPKWQVSAKKLKEKYSLKKALVVNDVQAQGEGLKTLYQCNQTSILMTAGTGLGGCFIVNGSVIPGEVGQIKTEEGLKIEDSVSGPGIIRLYHSFGGDRKINSARKIEELRDQKDKIAQKTFKTFYQEWGKIAARLGTGLYAMGGIYLWGGLIPKTDADKKVLLISYRKNLPKVLQKMPLRLVKDKSLAFKGLASLSRQGFG